MNIKISVMKREMKDGKAFYRDFTFQLDPQQMAHYKTRAALNKRIDQYIVQNSPFGEEDLPLLKYNMQEFLDEWKRQVELAEQEAAKVAQEQGETANDTHEEVERVYDLNRFIAAQEMMYEIALDEMIQGRKSSHWIWYIFPQQKGLGHSYNSQYYGLEGEGEARAYLAHPVLGERLRHICEALLTHEGKRDIDHIMGSGIDVLKLQTSMNLFNRISPNDIFEKVLDAFF